MSQEDFIHETAATFSTHPLVAEAHHYAQLLPSVLDLPGEAGRDAKLERLGAAGGVLSKLYVRADDACAESLGYALDHAPDHSPAAALKTLLAELADCTITYGVPETFDPDPALDRLSGASGRLRLLLNRLEEDIRRTETGGGT